ncbi:MULTISPECIES: peptide deformylase [unclassified Rhizobium]|uniref:peptide deformylase n=1 Tax=unclassified Rhizobium TaxID=2613769 RepID=UPI001ADD5841|nr:MULTISPECIES: peptide deformylase [unclassified Rhizobium]MBO9101705.1 peptide deformylase [Rhizobium sp. L58/93]MBO9136437.1 peptide deformylase [Rhizobium sp. B209b/85]MBO9188259.1 peptide deformylase [Rhizobium sp. E27B/91]QXZ86122.1 peptide deformylase [Rhizobium sp. K1/93]QXZ92422.1 peptide deformylase [Rhizobium sp. K15/93]
MTLRTIITIPDPALRQISDAVAPQAAETAVLIDDMLETMYNAFGVGLAAVQIGILKRVVVVDVGVVQEARRDARVLINPVIVDTSTECSTFREGCLSLPGTMVDVVRPARITVEYDTLGGGKETLEAEGLLATCLQHEIDHLNGTLITDHGEPVPREPQESA